MKIKIDMIDDDMFFFYGKYGWDKYKRKLKQISGFSKEDLKEKMPTSKDSGRCAVNIMWVRDKKNIKVILHELSHLIDHFMDHLSAEDETEFRAFLTEYIGGRIFKKVLKK